MHLNDKKKLVENIIEILQSQADNLQNAAKTAREDATNEESKSENKYDTRGLEASYLSGAQAAMAIEIKQNIAVYKAIDLYEFNENSKIALTAFIELESEDGMRSFYFLGAKAGGTEIKFNNMQILLITPSSPMGKSLIGRQIGDEFEINAGNLKKHYEIINIS
ncbi:GreA/GreB family elongation factor [Rickettsiales bacterium]|nr:GreA/GreB family elongation factor [Rickettsiales bacterium]